VSASSTRTALRRVPASSPAAELAAITAQDGAVIVEQAFSREVVERFVTDTAADLAAQPFGPKHGHRDAFWGVNTRQLHDLFPRSRTFREEIIDADLLHDIGDKVFGGERTGYCLVDADIIDVGPGSAAQQLHRDLERYPPFITLGPAMQEIMITFLIALTDFTIDNGGTRVIPGSNHWTDFSDKGTESMSVATEMAPGDMLYFSGKTSHGTGGNVTENIRRATLSIGFQVGYLKPKANWPFLIDHNLAATLTPRVRRLVGFPTDA